MVVMRDGVPEEADAATAALLRHEPRTLAAIEQELTALRARTSAMELYAPRPSGCSRSSPASRSTVTCAPRCRIAFVETSAGRGARAGRAASSQLRSTRSAKRCKPRPRRSRIAAAGGARRDRRAARGSAAGRGDAASGRRLRFATPCAARWPALAGRGVSASSTSSLASDDRRGARRAGLDARQDRRSARGPDLEDAAT